MLSEVHREAGRLAGQLGAEVHRHVYGPLHGRLEHGFPSLQLAAAAGESQHVKLLDEGGTMRGRDKRPVQVVGGDIPQPPQPLPWQSNKPSLNRLHPLAFISTKTQERVNFPASRATVSCSFCLVPFRTVPTGQGI